MASETFSEILKGALVAHAQQTIERSPTNARYVERVLTNIHLLDELLLAPSGTITGLVTTWRQDFLPIASVIFGPELTLQELPELPTGYSATTIEGLLGKVSVISVDEIMGPMYSLDVTKV